MKAICNKGICVFLFLSLLMSATMVNAQRVITASGKYITKNIKVTRFDQIYLKGSPTIEYTQSPGASKVQIAGSDNLVDLVECRVEGSTLIVNMKSHTNISYGKEGRLKILVSSPMLKSASLQGSGDIHLGSLKVEGLDVSFLQRELLTPVLGIGDPRTDKRIDFIGGIRGLEELKRRADSDMEVAFAMYPTSIQELFAVADADLLMPPKSTWFEPKLRSGLFIHQIER